MFDPTAPPDDFDMTEIEQAIAMESMEVNPPETTKLSTLVTSEPPDMPTLTSIGNFLNDTSYDITNEQLIAAMTEMKARWTQYPRQFPGMETVCAYRLYGLDPDVACVDTDALKVAENESRNKCYNLYNRMVTQKMIDAADTSDCHGKHLYTVMQLIGRNADVIRSRSTLADSNTDNFSSAASNSSSMWNLRMGVGMAGDEDAVAALTGKQRFILNSLEIAHSMNFRKHQGHLFKQVIVNGNRTHAWESHCSIEEFIYSCVDKNEDFDRWKDFTSGVRVSDLVEYITKATRDLELVPLNPDRNIFSFNNGVYDAFNDRMYFYEDGAIPERFVAAKYFDVAMPGDYEDFRDIPTPALDGILDHQKFSREPETPPKYANSNLDEGSKFSVVDWIYVFMGRMIYEIGEHDTWQALMFMKGKAGTGKSTLGKVLSFLYNAIDVGVLSNNIETKFGLSGLVDKLIYICFEVKRDFKLDQGEMQSMISGEPIGIATKGKDPRSVVWKTHGFFMGNEFPAWTNNSGSIARRIITVLFNEVVTEGDPRLFDKLQAEMGNIIVKINRAYRQCAALYGGDDIWNLLPPYFHEMREKQLEASTNPITAFLVYLRYEDNGHTFRFDPDGSVPYMQFMNCADAWIASNLGTKHVNWVRDVDGVFARYKLRKDDNDLYGLSQSLE